MRAVNLFIALLASAVPGCLTAAENWMFATPEPLPNPINLSNYYHATPWISADGLTLYFSSNRPGGQGGIDLWAAERSSVNDSWNTATNLGSEINTSRAELGPCLSADGLTLYFMDGNPFGTSSRAGGPGNYQIWTSTRATKQSPWTHPVDLKSPIGSTGIESYPHVTPDGLELYFTSDRSTPVGLFVSKRASVDQPWLTATNLGPTINQGTWTGFPHLSSSGLHLLYYSDRAGGRGGHDLWMSTRTSVNDAWQASTNLGAQVNSAYYEVSSCVSADFPALGSYLLFARNDQNGWNTRFKIYRAEVIPNLTLQRASTTGGPWAPVAASFAKVSTNACKAETAVSPAAGQSFYRVMMTGQDSTLRIASSGISSNKFRIEFEWARE